MLDSSPSRFAARASKSLASLSLSVACSFAIARARERMAGERPSLVAVVDCRRRALGKREGLARRPRHLLHIHGKVNMSCKAAKASMLHASCQSQLTTAGSWRAGSVTSSFLFWPAIDFTSLLSLKLEGFLTNIGNSTKSSKFHPSRRNFERRIFENACPYMHPVKTMFEPCGYKLLKH